MCICMVYGGNLTEHINKPATATVLQLRVQRKFSCHKFTKSFRNENLLLPSADNMAHLAAAAAAAGRKP